VLQWKGELDQRFGLTYVEAQASGIDGDADDARK
jgi:hypothetical protein